MQQEKLLSSALDIGEQMLVSGAEISRVEDSIKRICRAYDCARVDVFTITSSIVLTLTDKDGNSVTGTRRIVKYSTDLEKLHRLNELSRKICADKPHPEYIESELDKIKAAKPYNLFLQCLACAAVAGAFTVFFGGTWLDGAASALIGVVLKLTVFATNKTKVNMVFANVVCSAIASFLAFLCVRTGFGNDADKIIIGNIMLLIPGVALTNSIRDMISGDIMSGMLRFCEAVVVALAIAAGYILVAVMMKGGAL